MNEQNIKEILSVILDCIKDKKFTWRIEGSSNLKIQGINVSVRDLDITTNNEGIKIFREALKKFIAMDFFSQKIDGFSLVCNIKGFEVEINSYHDKNLHMFVKLKEFCGIT